MQVARVIKKNQVRGCSSWLFPVKVCLREMLRPLADVTVNAPRREQMLMYTRMFRVPCRGAT